MKRKEEKDLVIENTKECFHTTKFLNLEWRFHIFVRGFSCGEISREGLRRAFYEIKLVLLNGKFLTEKEGDIGQNFSLLRGVIGVTCITISASKATISGAIN